jgi:hypothetical protein
MYIHTVNTPGVLQRDGTSDSLYPVVPYNNNSVNLNTRGTQFTDNLHSMTPSVRSFASNVATLQGKVNKPEQSNQQDADFRFTTVMPGVPNVPNQRASVEEVRLCDIMFFVYVHNGREHVYIYIYIYIYICIYMS